MSQPPPVPESLLSATIEHLQRDAPFDRMEQEPLTYLVSHLRLGYYPKDAIILTPAHGVAQSFYVIKQGTVVGEQVDEGRADEGANWQLVQGECFPLGALLAARPVASVYRAVEDTFCYELPVEHFTELIRRSLPFRDFCTRRIANLLEQSTLVIQAQYSQKSNAQQSLRSALSTLIRRQPVTCRPETSIHDALQAMQEHRIGSIAIVDEHGGPAGMFTLADLLAKVALTRADISRPIGSFMSTDLVTLPPQAFAHEAAMEMARRGVHHVLIVDNRQLVGVISEKDLFSLQRLGLTEISAAIHNATASAALVPISEDIRQLAHNLLAQGVAAEQLTQFIATLNDLLTQRVIALACREAGLEGLEFCWLSLGSEGRQEQTLNTDQDNGIIFRVPTGGEAEQVRAALLPMAGRVNQALAECGFPLCKGNIMAGNPQWCLSLDEWDARFAAWVQRGDAPVLLQATIFFDFRPLYGVTDLARELRTRLHQKIRENRLFLRNMVMNALGNRPPLGVIRDFVVSDADELPHSMDLKCNGITPFVDAARIYSLAAGLAETNTLRRLRGIGEQWHMEQKQINAWIDAFFFIQLLRLRVHHEQREQGRPLSNRVDPDTLNDLDRRILKEAFRQARKLQALLERDFQF